MSTYLVDEEQIDSREFELNNEEKLRKIQVFNPSNLILDETMIINYLTFTTVVSGETTARWN